MVGIFDPACELLPPWTKELYLCTVTPLASLWPHPPLPKVNVQYLQTVCHCGGGGGVELCCKLVDHILQGFTTLFLTRFRTYKIASPPQKIWPVKTTFRLLVSLKFLRPWICMLLLSRNLGIRLGALGDFPNHNCTLSWKFFPVLLPINSTTADSSFQDILW
jgi:hypothetical protein